MKNKIGMLAAAMVLSVSAQAHAWNGPLCYLSTTKKVTLQLRPIAGEKASELQVSFEDNDGELNLESVRDTASGAHQIVLTRPEGSMQGIIGVILKSPRSQYTYEYEFEFRGKVEDCAGTQVEASEMN